jgi:hypothetical protein
VVVTERRDVSLLHLLFSGRHLTSPIRRSGTISVKTRTGGVREEDDIDGIVLVY